MKKLFRFLRRSFSARLSLWVVLFAALIYLAAQAYSSMAARRSVKEEAILRANQVLENSALRLGNILEDVEMSADNLEWLVYRHLEDPDAMLEYSRTTVQGNPYLNGCSISFEPDYYKGYHYFSAYTGYVGDVLQTEQEGDDDYQYFYLGWYQLPKLLNQPCWTEPYNDWEQDDSADRQTQMQVSYCKPLTEADGRFIGAISLDISLRKLSETLSSVKPYPHSYNVLISRGGTFMVHPDADRLFYETIFTDGLVRPDPELDALGRDMLALGEGYRVLKVDGVRSYVFYTPLKSTGWSMAIVCPERDIFSGFNRLRRISSLLMLMGLLLMFAVCFRVIGFALKPLSELAAQAEDIASGHFDTPLPENTRPDEIGTLSRSFAHMQTSLVSYMDELTRTTARRAAFLGELKIARDIQMGMIPRTFPPFPDRGDIDLYASMTPAREVGGDLYDYFIQNEKLYFCIGDVSGKGIPASLFMAVARNTFRVVGQQGLPPSEIARQINETLSDGNDQLMFVTMFIGLLDLRTGDLDFCNCGHNPPVILSREGPRFLDCKPNTSIGILPGWTFEGERIPAFKGIPLFLYTDGLNEAENPAQEQFGNDRLLTVLGSQPYVDAETSIKSLQLAVSAHVGPAEQSDDLTMLCLEIRG
jgi:sigma-B regulation protein RsbU (phosphoserine phosphatase)